MYIVLYFGFLIIVQAVMTSIYEIDLTKKNKLVLTCYPFFPLNPELDTNTSEIKMKFRTVKSTF